VPLDALRAAVIHQASQKLEDRSSTYGTHINQRWDNKKSRGGCHTKRGSSTPKSSQLPN